MLIQILQRDYSLNFGQTYKNANEPAQKMFKLLSISKTRQYILNQCFILHNF